MLRPELYFLADKTTLSIIIGLWLFSFLLSQDVAGIKKSAYWGSSGIILFLFIILLDFLDCSYFGIVMNDKININYMNDLLKDDSIQCIACIILSFSFQTYATSIYECLEEKNEKTMMVTTSIGIFISMLIYLLVGTVGYFTYEDKINEYYILIQDRNFKVFPIVILYLNIAYLLNVLMSFPLTFFALRYKWILLIKITLTLIRNKITGIDTLHHHDNDNHNNHKEEEIEEIEEKGEIEEEKNKKGRCNIKLDNNKKEKLRNSKEIDNNNNKIHKKSNKDFFTEKQHQHRGSEASSINSDEIREKLLNKSKNK
jgi:hypothetical protein